MKLRACGWLLLFALACRSEAPPAEIAPAPAPSPHASEEIISPPLGGAEGLHRDFKQGLVLRYRMYEAGKAAVIEEWTVTAADDHGCTIHTKVFAEDGETLLEDQGEGTSTWAELATHAQFPAARTKHSDSRITVGAGTFETWLYEIAPAKLGEPLKRIQFARAFAGPPLWMELTVGDQVVMRMELISRAAP